MTNSSGEMKTSLGLIGSTINAMALIAPGAFLWTTYQLQSPPDFASNYVDSDRLGNLYCSTNSDLL